jgi:RHS repeat-associated protein
VRSTTGEYGTLEDRYEYDAFGKPYKGDLENGMNLGYTGKPYDAATGLYNYGYRDYKPEVARFTTVDPVRDGNNWFAYVNNDPVNWVDPWGLYPSPDQSYGQVKNLMDEHKRTREAEIYQKGGGGRYPDNPFLDETSTFCNQATFDVAETTGFNTSALYGGKKRDEVNATEAANNLVNTEGTTVNQVNGKEAQSLANEGYTVIAAWANPKPGLSGHLATVSPSSVPYNDTTGPQISNVSDTNNITTAMKAFAGNSPSYYYDPNQQFKYNPSVIAQRQTPDPRKTDQGQKKPGKEN